MRLIGTLLAGAVLGILLLGTARFVAAPAPEHAGVHYHANWAVVIDGERLDLTANRYMEDVFACSADPSAQRPEDRVHMHEANMDVVHIHAAGATWGHLLSNLGFAVGDDYLEIEESRYVNDGARTLKFIVNGSPVRSIGNRQILDQERLLISYGPESVEQVVAEQFPMVQQSAGEYNTMPDPASCSGSMEHEETTGERLRRAFLW